MSYDEVYLFISLPLSNNNEETIRNIDDKDIEGASDKAEVLASLSNTICIYTAWKIMMTSRKGGPYIRLQ